MIFKKGILRSIIEPMVEICNSYRNIQLFAGLYGYIRSGMPVGVYIKKAL